MKDWTAEEVVEILTRLRNHLREHRPELPIIMQAQGMIDGLQSGDLISPVGMNIWSCETMHGQSRCPNVCEEWRNGDRVIHLQPK